MNFKASTRSAGALREMLYGSFQPPQATVTTGQRIGQGARRGLAVVLSALMIMVPLGLGNAFAQSPNDSGQYNPAPAPDDQSGYNDNQSAYNAPIPDNGQPQAQALSPVQLDQLVAPVALYPDALLAQVLAAATYPNQIVEADRWRQAQGNLPAEQIAAVVEAQNWDPSVKALTAFPTVLAQMDRNLQWTTDLGNAYYNQPQDVMDCVQAMRQKAESAGQLRSTPQQVVTNAGSAITIAPANPTVVYVPAYNPWTVYGTPVAVYPGYYYAPPAGVFWGGLAIGFGVGIGIAALAQWGWGWGHWGIGWANHSVFFNHNNYFTHSTTVINRGFNRPGGPGRSFGVRGAYAARGGFNRPGGGFNRPVSGYRGAYGAGYRGSYGGNRSANYGRPGGTSVASGARAGSYGRPAGNYGRPTAAMHTPSANYSRGPASYSRPTGNYARPGGTMHAPAANYSRSSGNFDRPSAKTGSPRGSMSHGSGFKSGGGHSSGGHSSGGHSSGGHATHAKAGGHSSGHGRG